MEHFGGAFRWNILVEHLGGGTFRWNILVEHFGGAFRWSI